MKKFFEELSRRLREGGVESSNVEDRRLEIFLHGQPVLFVSPGNDVFLFPAGSNNPEASELYHRVAQTADEVYTYVEEVQTAPTLHISGLSEKFHLLADFGGAVLAGRELENGRGYQFVTWIWDYNRTGVSYGHYYGGGTDSTAMLVGLWRHHVPVDLILFADPGAEQPHTYAYLDTMSRWLENHGMPAITRVWYTEKNGQRLTLEQECLRSGTLPSIAYGYKKCSLKHKVAPQEKFCRHYQPCIDAWEKGEKVVKFIGYDAGEERRLLNALPHDLQDKKYQKEYPLMEWGWSRKDCIQAIRDAGLPLPGKSSCFFCPSMKRWEIRTLYHRYPDLLRRALAIEDAAMPNLTSVRGLGRNWAWRDFICADENQLAIPGAFSDEDLPCSCCMKGELPTADL